MVGSRHEIEWSATDRGGMSHDDISQDQLFFFDEHEVVVSDFDVSGWILDVGGGAKASSVA